MSEEQLINKCLKQDPKAQKALYEKYAPKMLGICMRYIKDRTNAEDVMIRGFLKVFEKMDQFNHSGSFEGWIKRIMVNEALMFIRKNKNMYLEIDIEYAEKEPDYQNLENMIEASELMKIINGLPTGYRTIFNLYAIEGYSHKEIADMLEISENTSKSQLSRARLFLQKRVVQWEQELNRKYNENEQRSAR